MEIQLSQLLRQSLEANVIVYNAALNALGKGKQWKLAMNLLSSMRRLWSLGSFFPERRFVAFGSEEKSVGVYHTMHSLGSFFF